MNRYELREVEQQHTLEELFHFTMDSVEQHGDLEWDAGTYELATLILEMLPRCQHLAPVKEVKSKEAATLVPFVESVMLWPLEITRTSHVHACAAIVAAALFRFSRTSEEAEYLLWRFFAKITECLASRFTREYFRQSIHEQSVLFGGPGMDDVPDEEARQRLANLDRTNELHVVRPT